MQPQPDVPLLPTINNDDTVDESQCQCSKCCKKCYKNLTRWGKQAYDRQIICRTNFGTNHGCTVTTILIVFSIVYCTYVFTDQCVEYSRKQTRFDSTFRSLGETPFPQFGLWFDMSRQSNTTTVTFYGFRCWSDESGTVRMPYRYSIVDKFSQVSDVYLFNGDNPCSSKVSRHDDNLSNQNAFVFFSVQNWNGKYVNGWFFWGGQEYGAQELYNMGKGIVFTIPESAEEPNRVSYHVTYSELLYRGHKEPDKKYGITYAGADAFHTGLIIDVQFVSAIIQVYTESLAVKPVDILISLGSALGLASTVFSVSKAFLYLKD